MRMKPRIPSEPSRRSFLKTMLAAGTAPMVLRSGLLASDAPSNKITLGFIGVGWQGVDLNLKSFLTEDDCRCVTVCDAYMSRAKSAKKLVDEAYGNQDCICFRYHSNNLNSE